MNTNFAEWVKKLENLVDKIDKEISKVRDAKVELQQAKKDLIDQLAKGQYYRDDERIVISAPEIIIGNLAKDGTMNTDKTSKIILRSNDITIEGVSQDQTSGRINQKATIIQNTCINPGIDGLEHVVEDKSMFTVHACNIGMLSEDTKEGFIDEPTAGNGEITLKADKKINLKAAKPANIKEKKLASTIENKKNEKDKLKKECDAKKTVITENLNYLEYLKDFNKNYIKGQEELSTNCVDIENLEKEIEMTVTSLTSELCEYGEMISQLAEATIEHDLLKKQQEAIKKYAAADDVKKKSTGSSINIVAETTNIHSMDDDNNIRENDEAGLKIQAKNVTISTAKSDGSVIDKSEINLQSQNIKLSTENSNEEGDNVNFPAEGNIHVASKNIVIEAVDYERKKGEERKEKALTKDGCIKMRAENMELSSYDTEGKASGKFSLNSKNISLKAMDVDKEKLTDKEMAKDSKMLLLTDKIYAGDPEEKSLTQQIQLAADKVGIFAKTTAEIQQDEAKAAVQLDGGNIALSGSKMNLFGETTVNGKTTFKADTVQGKATVDNIEIKTSLKSPKTSEGIAVPSSPSSEKISTKLKEDKDINKQEEKS